MHFNRWFRLDEPDEDPDNSFISAGSEQLWLRLHEADGSLLNLLATAITQLAGPDWTGRQIRKDKVGVSPAECAPISERLDCTAETWVDFVKNCRKRFRNEAGLAPSSQAFRTTRRESRASVNAN